MAISRRDEEEMLRAHTDWAPKDEDPAVTAAKKRAARVAIYAGTPSFVRKGTEFEGRDPLLDLPPVK